MSQVGMSYVPLWCKSNYSFLEGASHPEELVCACAARGIPRMAITDRDGLYGVVRAHRGAKEAGGDTGLIIGSEINVQDAWRVVLLAQDRRGYSGLCRLITAGRLRHAKGRCSVTWEEVRDHAAGLLCLWVRGFEDAPLPMVQTGKDAFGDRLYACVSRHLEPGDPGREAAIRERCRRMHISSVAATEVLYHTKERRRLQDVLTCIRHNTTLYSAGTLLCANDEHDLKTPEEMARLYHDCPDLLQQTTEIANRCTFSLEEIHYRYPSELLPHGYTGSQWLRELTFRGARQRYSDVPEDVTRQLDRELRLIDELDYCGYFLTMWDIVEYCRDHGILCQGRGSAANSAVCYCLGITAVDPVRMDLLFERFISRERAEPPDIDLDIEHRRREEVIQHMYAKYGRNRAAMVANVIRFRRKSAAREVGKVLGIPATTLDRLAKFFAHRETDVKATIREAGVELNAQRMSLFALLAQEILDFPRHLSIHPGGFLLGSEPVCDLVPIENATMEDRTVIQWDKTDVEDMGLFKVDLLGLGALTHLRMCFALLREHLGLNHSMATLPGHDPALFRMICAADTVGVFQIESRAQMSMLPRLRPQTFYDIVIEVAIVRPGPISGGMVHPYLRRRSGEEKIVYPHPCLRRVLEKTLGIPLFQEQVMRLAVLAADYSPGEADQLRRDMAAWRRSGRLEQHRERLISRMLAKGIAREFAEQVFNQIRGFGEYGFPESHAASFALIAYATAWMKCHYPLVFACGLLNAWPMGFYSPASIVEDAKRHGVRFLPVDVLYSAWECLLVEEPSPPHSPTPHSPTPGATTADAHLTIRMGLRFVRGLGRSEYDRVAAARERTPAGRAHANLGTFLRAAKLPEDVALSLARSGAFGCFGPSRRQAMWEVSGVSRRVQAAVHAVAEDEHIPDFPELAHVDEVGWDHGFTGHSTRAHPVEPYREQLRDQGLPEAGELADIPDGARISYAGLVICRQRPSTAKGTVFATLEDETGFVNLVFWKDVFRKYRTTFITTSFLGITGKLQSESGVTHVIVEKCWKPRLGARSRDAPAAPSRDFR